MTSVSIVSLSLRAACGRITAGGWVDNQQRVYINEQEPTHYRFHDGHARLLFRLRTLHSRKETCKEAGFFLLAVYIKIPAIVDLAGRELAAFGVGWWLGRFVCVESFVDN
jgi:hypothetical protein